MDLCIFEDSSVEFLEPIALTRPVQNLWCGTSQLWQRQRRVMSAGDLGAWIRPRLVPLTRHYHPNWIVNDRQWLGRRPRVIINGRWIPTADINLEGADPHIGVIGEQVAYVVQPSASPGDFETPDAWLAACRKSMPHRPAPGKMIDFLWHLVDSNGDMVRQDIDWVREGRTFQNALPPHVTLLGNAENFLIEESASVEPFVMADTRQGPVIIDRGAVIHSFTRLEGPCYIGPDSVILGAKIRAGTTLGPCCRIGGEVEESIVQGYTNKYHEGFLGHSYLGEWVNLAAATQTSDLRNDYGVIRLTVNGQRMSTGHTKIGSYIGDHTKTGLSALLNTGSVIGVFCNILPSGALLPQIVPSFCQVQYGQVVERWDLKQMLGTAATVMKRRGREIADVHREFCYDLFEATSNQRRKTIRDYEIRRMRRTL